MSRWSSWLSRRSTGDLLVLLIAGTVCGMVAVAGFGVLIVSILRPEANVQVVIGRISDTVNTLIGLLAGFLAGRTDSLQQQARHQQQAPADDDTARVP